ncbi:MAG: inorganic phosphate transporter [Rhodanobacter sp. 68-29]|uniref:inorganic phosphate transporter n=1 Tax=Rhodanobacter sp. PCA2 TaxID=2006117 RepID=UPI00086E0B84|nr:inorganic phosphate transporter [Rhodanobacter sp. PCA2]MBA2079205.1 inorganic phosphate transporter [Rhodanobacter sp. PCA2]MBN8922211.1 inorganic phosphate transporter [Rhodanobacter sp.]ODU73448.1 MAG: inorganic phosphate transporter [Rhodanobacter sp. SCN 69-32]OJY55907.1 MAG: inorganic phosphate transporter [Rhodanobacter sp. 68-29]
MSLGLVVVVVAIALVFTYINGFHDTANSIATVVATKVLTPGQAVLLAAVTNLIGALWGTAVAATIAAGIVNTGVVEAGPQLLICALLAAIVWNLITWWRGLPSSSSHALVGALVGAAIGAAGGRFDAVVWARDGLHWWQGKGVIPKVVVPMVASPIMGLVIGFLLMGALYALLAWFSRRGGWLRLLGRTPFVNSFFGKAQIASASAMGLAHGMNDAQKSMGIIALALASATAAGQFDQLPAWLHFLRIHESTAGGFTVPAWVAVVCALTMAGGTAGGGWRIIKTLGHKMVKLHPINGFAAEGSSAIVILTASAFGLPVSTTHVVSSAIMGVGSAKRSNAIKWSVVERMVWAWILTLPVTALIAWCFVVIARLLG